MKSAVSTHLDAVFGALAHPIRRSLVASLEEGPRTVVELAEPHPVSLNAVSKHLKTLEAAGLIVRQRDGNFHRLSLDADSMRPAVEWMAHYAPFWRGNLASLKRHLEDA